MSNAEGRMSDVGGRMSDVECRVSSVECRMKKIKEGSNMTFKNKKSNVKSKFEDKKASDAPYITDVVSFVNKKMKEKTCLLF